MPYVKGESLRERLTQHGELPVAEAVKVLRGVVDALAHAHFGPVYLVDCHSERNPVDPRYAADSISTESSTATWPGSTVDP